MQLQLKILSDI
jgi:choline/ethanolamine kinase